MVGGGAEADTENILSFKKNHERQRLESHSLSLFSCLSLFHLVLERRQGRSSPVEEVKILLRRGSRPPATSFFFATILAEEWGRLNQMVLLSPAFAGTPTCGIWSGSPSDFQSEMI